MKVVFVVGGTASGKSQLALDLAHRFNGAIVNCDSIQCYQGLIIGSALPSEQDFQQVPHYLYSFVKPMQKLTAGEYTRMFFETLQDLENKYPIVFVVGGTGFYYQAIEKGMYSVGAASPEIKAQIEKEILLPNGPEKMFEELRHHDPEYAAKISPNDHYRLMRALEVLRFHGRSMTEIQTEFLSLKKPFPYPLLKLGLKIDKELLKQRVVLRTDKMLADGFINEVKDLVKKGFADWEPMQSVGYREVLSFIKGEIPSEQSLKSLIIQSTMQLAKKQRTWFKRDHEINWLEVSPVENNSSPDGHENSGKLFEKAYKLVLAFKSAT